MILFLSCHSGQATSSVVLRTAPSLAWPALANLAPSSEGRRESPDGRRDLTPSNLASVLVNR